MKRLFFFGILAVIGFAPHAFAQGFTALAPIPGLTSPDMTSVVNQQGFATFFNQLYKYCIGIAAVLAVIQIIRSGIDIAVLHKDSVSSITDDKGKIYNAIFGLVLVLSPVLVFSIINPSILNLSLSIPALDTQTSAPSIGSSGAPATTDSASGCSVSGQEGLLQIVICQSSEQRDKYFSDQSCKTNLRYLSSMENGNGVPIYVATCATLQKFTFINPAGNWLSAVVNSIRPVTATVTNPSNGSQIMTFMNICKNTGLDLQTCVSDKPTYSMSIPCDLPQGSGSNTTWKCYPESLSCESSVGASLSGNCSKTPNWIMFP